MFDDSIILTNETKKSKKKLRMKPKKSIIFIISLFNAVHILCFFLFTFGFSVPIKVRKKGTKKCVYNFDRH